MFCFAARPGWPPESPRSQVAVVRGRGDRCGAAAATIALARPRERDWGSFSLHGGVRAAVRTWCSAESDAARLWGRGAELVPNVDV